MDESRLLTERNIWLSTVRSSGRPHLVPIWFVWWSGRAYVCTQGDSVKIKNLRANPRVSFALENGDKPVIGEGAVEILDADFPTEVVGLFKQKYDWDIPTDTAYSAMIVIAVEKWLKW